MTGPQRVRKSLMMKGLKTYERGGLSHLSRWPLSAEHVSCGDTWRLLGAKLEILSKEILSWIPNDFVFMSRPSDKHKAMSAT